MRIAGSILLLAAVACVGCASNKQTITVDGRRDTAEARSLNERAFKLIQEGKFDEAEKLCKRAVDADIMYGPAHNNLGLIYYHQQKLYAAAWEFQNSAKLMPYQPEPRNNLGLVFERAGKMEDAAGEYANARAMEPDNPQYLGNLARAHIRKGDRDDNTRALLEELVMKDDRPEWRDWARMNLYRMPRPATSAPSSPTSPSPGTP